MCFYVDVLVFHLAEVNFSVSARGRYRIALAITILEVGQWDLLSVHKVTLMNTQIKS